MRRRTGLEKVLAWVFSLVLLVGMMPTAALAEALEASVDVPALETTADMPALEEQLETSEDLSYESLIQEILVQAQEYVANDASQVELVTACIDALRMREDIQPEDYNHVFVHLAEELNLECSEQQGADGDSYLVIQIDEQEYIVSFEGETSSLLTLVEEESESSSPDGIQAISDEGIESTEVTPQEQLDETLNEQVISESEANATEELVFQEEVEPALETQATNGSATNRINAIKQKDGYKPGQTSGCATKLSAHDCYGFAWAVTTELYGKHNFISGVVAGGYYAKNSTGDYNLIGTVKSGALSSASVKSLLSKAYPGDIVQFRGSGNGYGVPQHTFVVEAATDAGITIYEHTGKRHITSRYFSWGDFYSSYCQFNTSKSDNGISLYHYKNYEKVFPPNDSTPTLSGKPQVRIGTGTYIIQSKVGNRCLDIASGSTANGANAQIYIPNGTAAQIFSIGQADWLNANNISLKGSGRYLDASGGANSKAGANVQLYDGNGGKNQNWVFENAGDGYYFIRNVIGYYLDVDNGTNANGTNVKTWNFNGGDAQKWKVIPVSGQVRNKDLRGSYFIQTKLGNRVLDATGGNPANGTNVYIWNPHYNSTHPEGEIFAIGWNSSLNASNIMLKSSGKFVDAAGGTSKESNVHMWEGNGNWNQNWFFEDAGGGYWYIRNMLGYYLEVDGAKTDNGTNVSAKLYKGSDAQKWKLLDLDISRAEVSGIQDETYTGSAQTQTPTVRLNNITLQEGKDYTLSYKNNVEPGTASITIAGKGEYSGSKGVSFQITKPEPIPISAISIKVEDYPPSFTGQALKPSYPGYSLSYNGVDLVEGKDYTVSFSNNVNAGTATITFMGIGAYSGTASRTYTIDQAIVSDTLAGAGYDVTGLKDVTYTGKAHTPKPTVSYYGLTFPDYAMAEGTDYTLAYRNNINVGTAAVLITGKGNFDSGTIERTFKIKPANVSAVTIGSVANQTYTGKALTPKPKLTFNGMTLKEGTDYTLSYENNTKVGTATITITGKGNYTGTKSATFKIVEKPSTTIDFSQVDIALTNTYYDGTPQIPQYTVTYNGKSLTEGKDFSVTYKDNLNASHTASAVFVGKGNYKGSQTHAFSVYAAPLDWVTIGTIANQTYTGKALTPKPKLTYKGMTLKEGTDYTLTYKNNTKVGTATVTVAGKSSHMDKGNYIGTKSVTFKIVAASISKATVSAVANQTYTGKALTPKPTVKIGNTTLKEGTDYTLSYKNNTNVGTATITITGKGNYTGTTSTTFKIVEKPKTDISKATVSAVANQTYTGKALTPKPTVKLGSTTLKESTNYTLSYKSNTKVGTATIAIAGKGNFTGTKSVTFKVVAANLTKASVSSVANQTYTGKALTPKPTVKLGSTTLKEGTDYTLSYKNNTKVGTATITITGKGNYTGTKSVVFTISPISITKASIVVDDQVFDGSTKRPAPLVTLSGKTLSEGTDYTVSYTDNTNTGTATVTISGKGIYSGTVSTTFTITEPVVEPEPMYRLYNPNSGEHFYTASEYEKDHLDSIGWRYEGIGWWAPKKSNTPVYRLYNKNAGDHHYTISTVERDHLIKVGWRYEGIGWYSDDAKGVPLYRQYNPNAKAGAHNYTTNKAENDWLVSLGWRAEGIGWYGVKR